MEQNYKKNKIINIVILIAVIIIPILGICSKIEVIQAVTTIIAGLLLFGWMFFSYKQSVKKTQDNVKQENICKDVFIDNDKNKKLTIGGIIFSLDTDSLNEECLCAKTEINGIFINIELNKSKDFYNKGELLNLEIKDKMFELLPALTEKYNFIINTMTKDYSQYLSSVKKVKKINKEEILSNFDTHKLDISFPVDATLSTTVNIDEDYSINYLESSNKCAVTIMDLKNRNEIESEETQYNHILVKNNTYIDNSNSENFCLGKLGTFQNVELDSELKEGLDEEKQQELLQELKLDWAKRFTKLNTDYLLDYALTMVLFESSAADIDFWVEYRAKEDEFSNDYCKENFESLCDAKDFETISYEFENEKKHFRAQEFIRMFMPYVDLDKLINSINIEYIVINKNRISVQFSDKTAEVFCSAYFELLTSWKIEEWHNF